MQHNPLKIITSDHFPDTTKMVAQENAAASRTTGELFLQALNCATIAPLSAQARIANLLHPIQAQIIPNSNNRSVS